MARKDKEQYGRSWAPSCEKGCKAFTYSNPRTKIVDTVLIGCTPIVQDCARVNRWDRRHGLIQPYTIVENKDYLD